MPVKLKSVYEPPSPLDGYRVLCTQYWPRGIRRELVNEYVRKLAPSRELLHAFRSGQLDWEGYKERYLEEVDRADAAQEIKRLRELSTEGTVTILCVCRDENHCHRGLLKALIEGESL